VAAEWQALDDDAPVDETTAAQGEPLEQPLLGDEQCAAAPGEPERRAQLAHQHLRVRRAAANRDERAARLG
jgi:hypothetical protein